MSRPGSAPGQPYMKSMMGIQSNSKLRSSPNYGFGTAVRPDMSNMQKGGKASPGPIYNPDIEVGRPSSPQHSFGVSHRYAVSARKSAGAEILPGPGQYTHSTSVGAQMNSQKHSAQTVKFGTGTREDRAKIFISHAHSASDTTSISSPGPAAYSLQNEGSVGGNYADSKKHSSPEIGIGTSRRFFNKSGAADVVPGPGSYKLQASVGRQIHTHRRTDPVNSFTRADRDKIAQKQYLGKKLWIPTHDSPGPQAPYSLPASVGIQHSSARKNTAKYGFSRADRFGYIDQGAKQCNTPGPGSYSL